MRGFFHTPPSSQAALPAVPRCGACGLYRHCHSPKMPPYGEGKRSVLVVGEAPGETEDERGRPFVGTSGQLLRTQLQEIGVDLDEDAWVTNSVICRPVRNATPTPDQILCCYPNLNATLKKLRPKVVITLGRSALHSVLLPYWQDVGALERWIGWQIPLPDFWLCPTYHPAYLLRTNQPTLDRAVLDHLRSAFALVDQPRPQVDTRSIVCTFDEAKVEQTIKAIVEEEGWVAVDYETNCLKPETPEGRIFSCALSNGKHTISFLWTPRTQAATAAVLFSKHCRKIAANLKMEERWTRHVFGRGVVRWGWDTMLAAHVLDNRQGICSLKFQALVRLGIPAYNQQVEAFLTGNGRSRLNRITEIEPRTLLRYGGMDALLEWHLAKLQRKEMGYGD